jgi:26 proteasome complex subunit DSS1
MTTAGAIEIHSDILEEDDEFEEFEQQEWASTEEDTEDPTLWQDGWEDDDYNPEFTQQLRAELQKTDDTMKDS